MNISMLNLFPSFLEIKNCDKNSIPTANIKRIVAKILLLTTIAWLIITSPGSDGIGGIKKSNDKEKNDIDINEKKKQFANCFYLTVYTRFYYCRIITFHSLDLFRLLLCIKNKNNDFNTQALAPTCQDYSSH